MIRNALQSGTFGAHLALARCQQAVLKFVDALVNSCDSRGRYPRPLPTEAVARGCLSSRGEWDLRRVSQCPSWRTTWVMRNSSPLAQSRLGVVSPIARGHAPMQTA